MSISDIREKFNNLPGILKSNIIKKLLISGGVLVVLIFYIIVNFSFTNLIMALVMLAATATVIVYSFITLTSGNYNTVEGECIKINKPAIRVTNRHVKFFVGEEIVGKAYAVLRCNDNNVEIPIYRRSRVNRGQIIKVYFNEKNIYEDAPDYYKIVNPIAVDIVNSKNEDITEE